MRKYALVFALTLLALMIAIASPRWVARRPGCTWAMEVASEPFGHLRKTPSPIRNAVWNIEPADLPRRVVFILVAGLAVGLGVFLVSRGARLLRAQ